MVMTKQMMMMMVMAMMRFIIMMVIMMIFDDSMPTCFAKRSYTLFSIWLLLPGRFLEKTIACKIFINMMMIITIMVMLMIVTMVMWKTIRVPEAPAPSTASQLFS